MANEGRQTINLMEFKMHDVGNLATAVVALGHVGAREFRRAAAARRHALGDRTDIGLVVEPLYQYAVFRDDESIVFNVRPDEVGARPITVAYFGAEGPDQV